jgi:hypothetical protein
LILSLVNSAAVNLINSEGINVHIKSFN